MPKMNTINKIAMAAATAVICFAPSVFADQTVDMTGVGSGNYTANVYIGPYQATVNGVANTQVICDDFADETFVPEDWNASVSTVANLGSDVKWGQSNQTLYDEAAWLATQLMNPPSAADDAAIQYALWQLFYPTGTASDPGVQPWLNAYGLSSWDASTAQTGVQYWLNQAAMASNYDSSSWANVEVLTYDPNGNPNGPICQNGQTCPSTPQEFLVVTETPEPSTILLSLLGFGGMLFLLMRRQRSAGMTLAA
jgi:hypothetical protein